jgi:hypothetical protein
MLGTAISAKLDIWTADSIQIGALVHAREVAGETNETISGTKAPWE